MSAADTNAAMCTCAHHTDGSVTTFLCPLHADTDPCLTVSQVTGRRRKGTIRRGVCTACGWKAASMNLYNRPGRLNPAVRPDGSMSWDSEDLWGSTLSNLMAVIAVAEALGMDIPAEGMGYRPSAGWTRPDLYGLMGALDCADMNTCDDIAHDEHGYEAGVIAAGVVAGDITRDHLRLAMVTLNRYANAVRAAGLDY